MGLTRRSRGDFDLKMYQFEDLKMLPKEKSKKYIVKNQNDNYNYYYQLIKNT